MTLQVAPTCIRRTIPPRPWCLCRLDLGITVVTSTYEVYDYWSGTSESTTTSASLSYGVHAGVKVFTSETSSVSIEAKWNTYEIEDAEETSSQLSLNVACRSTSIDSAEPNSSSVMRPSGRTAWAAVPSVRISDRTALACAGPIRSLPRASHVAGTKSPVFRRMLSGYGRNCFFLSLSGRYLSRT